MKNISKTSSAHLPLSSSKSQLKLPRIINNDLILEESLEESDKTQVSLLDNWSARNYSSSKSNHSRMLYSGIRGSSIRRKNRNPTYTESAMLTESKLYLLGLDG